VSSFTESIVEDAALAWLEALGYAVLHGPDIAVGMLSAERNDPNYRDVVLERRIRDALTLLNPALPTEALEDAFRKLMRNIVQARSFAKLLGQTVRKNVTNDWTLRDNLRAQLRVYAKRILRKYG